MPDAAGMVTVDGAVVIDGAVTGVVLPLSARLLLVKYQFPADPLGVILNFITVPADMFCKAEIPERVETPAVPEVPLVDVVLQLFIATYAPPFKEYEISAPEGPELDLRV